MAARSFVYSFVRSNMDGGVRFYLVLTKSQPAPLDRLIDRVRTHGDSMEAIATEENGYRRILYIHFSATMTRYSHPDGNGAHDGRKCRNHVN